VLRRWAALLVSAVVVATVSGVGVGTAVDRPAKSQPYDKFLKTAIADIQEAGIEVDIWKIEGVDERSDCEMLAQQTRSGSGRAGVVCVLLGRGADDDKVDHWLRQAAPVGCRQ